MHFIPSLFSMDKPERTKPRYIGSFKCGKGHKQTVNVYETFQKITPEEQEVIDIKILKILGFL